MLLLKQEALAYKTLSGIHSSKPPVVKKLAAYRLIWQLTKHVAQQSVFFLFQSSFIFACSPKIMAMLDLSSFI